MTPGYFRTLSIPIVAGRGFTAEEAGRERAIGKRVTTPLSAAPLTIVGVARDANDVVIWREKEIALYVPASTATAGNMSLLVRTEGDVDAVGRALQRETAEYDKSLRFEALPLVNVLRLWILPSRVASRWHR